MVAMPRVQDRILPSGSKRQGVVSSGDVIGAIFPEGGDALASMDTAEGQDFFGTRG